MEIELFELNYLHHDTYQLLLYCLRRILSSTPYLVAAYISYFVIYFYVGRDRFSPSPFRFLPFSLAAGGVLPSIWSLYRRINQLGFNYKRRVDYLANHIERLKAELGITEDAFPVNK
jgi:hypothetical protein